MSFCLIVDERKLAKGFRTRTSVCAVAALCGVKYYSRQSNKFYFLFSLFLTVLKSRCVFVRWSKPLLNDEGWEYLQVSHEKRLRKLDGTLDPMNWLWWKVLKTPKLSDNFSTLHCKRKSLKLKKIKRDWLSLNCEKHTFYSFKLFDLIWFKKKNKVFWRCKKSRNLSVLSVPQNSISPGVLSSGKIETKFIDAKKKKKTFLAAIRIWDS